MDEKILQILKQEFPKLLKENLGSFQNMVVPQHRHNGVDSLYVNKTDKLSIGNTDFDGTNATIPGNFSANTITAKNIFLNNGGNLGIQFSNGSDIKYLIYEIDPPSDSGLVIEPYTGTFMGIGGPLFLGGGVVSGGSFSRINSTVSNGTDSSGSSFFPTGIAYTASGDFSLQLPDTTRVASPTAGMIAFEGGTFYACEVSGTWRTIVTAP